ncbi:MAG: hypothetical protein ACLQBK_22615 [Candidatus Sulfotelmatobacter sp.]
MGVRALTIATAFVLGTMILGTMILGTTCLAQDQPLGDVARETRARTAQAPKPAKVLSNEETDGRAITASDDPVDVVTKAVAAMLRDTSHSCRKVVSGNAPGLPLTRLIEIGGSDRLHMTVEQSSPQRILADLIVIGNDVYERTGGPWQKANPQENAQYQAAFGLSSLIPEELKFGYTRENLKLVGPMVIGGSAAFQYQFTSHDSESNRTINIWVGAGDYLPRRTEILTQSLRTKINQHETTDCTYGTNITIEPPF